MTERRGFTDKFKATVALKALRGGKTAQEVAAKHKIHPSQVTTRNSRQLITARQGYTQHDPERGLISGAMPVRQAVERFGTPHNLAGSHARAQKHVCLLLQRWRIRGPVVCRPW